MTAARTLSDYEIMAGFGESENEPLALGPTDLADCLRGFQNTMIERFEKTLVVERSGTVWGTCNRLRRFRSPQPSWRRSFGGVLALDVEFALDSLLFEPTPQKRLSLANNSD